MKDLECNDGVADEEGVYSEEDRESLVDDDEISAQEEAFMRGWDDAMDEEEALMKGTDEEEAEET